MEPFAEIPARELWLQNNEVALSQVKKGISQATAGALKSRGDFSAYAQPDDGDNDAEGARETGPAKGAQQAKRRPRNR